MGRLNTWQKLWAGIGIVSLAFGVFLAAQSESSLENIQWSAAVIYFALWVSAGATTYALGWIICFVRRGRVIYWVLGVVILAFALLLFYFSIEKEWFMSVPGAIVSVLIFCLGYKQIGREILLLQNTNSRVSLKNGVLISCLGCILIGIGYGMRYGVGKEVIDKAFLFGGCGLLLALIGFGFVDNQPDVSRQNNDAY